MARRYGSRGIGDYIPKSGEARALVEVKGRVGAKGAGMRRRRSGLFSHKNPNMEWSLMKTYDLQEEPDANALRYIMPLRANAVQNRPTRVLSWNPAYPGEAAGTAITVQDLNARLHRMIVELGLCAQVDWQIGPVGSIAQRSSASARNSYSLEVNALAAGAFDESVIMGATSHYEGIFVQWWWVYETQEEASLTAASNLNPFSADEFTKNRFIFDSGLECVSIGKPMVKRWDKKFPGRGLSMSQGDRETWQVSLYLRVQANKEADTPDPRQPAIGYTFGVARAQYLMS